MISVVDRPLHFGPLERASCDLLHPADKGIQSLSLLNLLMSVAHRPREMISKGLGGTLTLECSGAGVGMAALCASLRDSWLVEPQLLSWALKLRFS